MANPVAANFTLYNSVDQTTQLTNYIAPGYVLTYQNTPTGTTFNGVNFAVANSYDTHDPTGVIWTFPSLNEWTLGKLYTSHPYTSAELDPTRGNRLIGVPFLIERAAAVSDIIISAVNLNYLLLTGSTYDDSMGILIANVTSKSPVFPATNVVGLPFAVQIISASSSGFTGLDGNNVPYYNDSIEYIGTVTAYNGTSITVQFDFTCPALVSNLAGLKIGAIYNQKIAVLPLGTDISGTDSYPTLPTTYDWTYKETNRTLQSAVQTNRIKYSLPTIGDSVRFYVQAEVQQNAPFYNFGVGLVISTLF